MRDEDGVPTTIDPRRGALLPEKTVIRLSIEAGYLNSLQGRLDRSPIIQSQIQPCGSRDHVINTLTPINSFSKTN